MFTGMIDTLKAGQRISLGDLKRRLDAAIIKKGGILQQPKPCWSGDPKINPVTIHMLWAAVILGDIDAIATVIGMIEIELSSNSSKKLLNEFIAEKLNELSALSSNPETSNWLNNKVSIANKNLGLEN